MPSLSLTRHHLTGRAIPPLYLADISHISPIYLPYISHVSPLYLPISPLTSQDALLRVWDLHSLHLLATLHGHKERVRCLAGGAARYPHRLFSGSNDRHVRVWDLSRVLAGGHERGQPVGVHSAWVRAG